MNTISLPSRTLPNRTAGLLLVLLTVVSMGVVGAPRAHAAPVVATPTIVPFSEWAPAACPAPTGEEAAPVERLVVHHTHEPVAHTPEEVLPALALTCKAHTDRGFSTIGYHYVVDPWGGIYQGRGSLPGDDGSPPATQGQGAHVAGSNAGAVGVVFLGDHEDEPPTAAALEAGTQLLAWLMEPMDVGPADYVSVVSTGVGTANFRGRAPMPALAGHSDSNHTACPGAHLQVLVPRIRDRVAQHLAGQEPVSWAGLAVDQPAEEPPAPEPVPAEEPADAAAAKAEKSADTAAAKMAAATAAADEALKIAAALGDGDATLSLPIGPLASRAEVLARNLRSVGLLSLAERLAPSAEAS